MTYKIKLPLIVQRINTYVFYCFFLVLGSTLTEAQVSNNSHENIYIQSIVLNGKDYKDSYIGHTAIINGGTMKIRNQDGE